MQLILAFAVLGALAIADAALKAPVPDAAWRWPAAVAVMLIPPLFAAAAALVTVLRLRNEPWHRALVLARFGRMRTLHGLVWLACAAGVLYGLDWTRLVRFNLGLDAWPLIDDALVMLPVLGPLVLSWAVYYEVDRATRALVRAARGFDGPGADDGETDAAAGWTRAGYVGFQFRTCAGIVLAPLAVLIVAQDVARLLWPELMAGEYAWTVYVPPFACVVALFPMLLRHIWRCEPLPPGPLRDRLEAASRRTGLRVRRILVWHTGRMVVNAAVAGLLPNLRYVFLSDALLHHMTDEEIEAVFGHEVGHIRYHHVFLRAMVLLVPVSLFVLLSGALPSLTVVPPVALVPGGPADARIATAGVAPLNALGWNLSGGSLSGIDVTGLATTGVAGLALLAAAGLYIVSVFGFCSRRFERQADLFGCRVVSPDAAGGDAPTVAGVRVFVSALEKLAVLNGIGRNAPSWQHSSIANRVAFLERVAVDPAQARRCDRQVRWLGGLIVGLVAAGFVLPALIGLASAATF